MTTSNHRCLILPTLIAITQLQVIAREVFRFSMPQGRPIISRGVDQEMETPNAFRYLGILLRLGPFKNIH